MSHMVTTANDSVLKPVSQPALPAVPETEASLDMVQGLNAREQELFWEKDERVLKAISETMPAREKDWEKCIFKFCRKLKAIEELKGATCEILRPISDKWAFACQDGTWPESTEFVWAKFRYGWKRVQYPEGETFLKALELANTDKELPSQQKRYKDEKVQLLLRLCFQLQQLGEDKSSFFLSYQNAGEVIGYSHTWGGHFLEVFVDDGVLQIINKHVYGPGTSSRATMYQFIEEQTQ